MALLIAPVYYRAIADGHPTLGNHAIAARNFKLLDELDEAEKSSKGGADISLGSFALHFEYLWTGAAGLRCTAGDAMSTSRSRLDRFDRHQAELLSCTWTRVPVPLAYQPSMLVHCLYAGLSRPDDTYMTDWQASIFAQAVSRSIALHGG